MALSGRIGTLNSDLVGEECSRCLVDTVGKGDGTIVFGEDVPVEADENIVFAGEMLGGRAVETIEGTLLESVEVVTGSLSSSRIFRTVVKSLSFLNFTWIRRT